MHSMFRNVLGSPLIAASFFLSKLQCFESSRKTCGGGRMTVRKSILFFENINKKNLVQMSM